MVRITGVRGAGAVDTGGFFQPGGQAEAGALIATGQAKGALPGIVAAAGDAYVGAQFLAFTSAGEDLNHAAHGIGSMNGRTRSAQNLDALDLIDTEKLQRRTTSGSRARSYTVDQHQRLSRARTADIKAIAGAAASVVGNLNTGHLRQQLGHAGRT